MNPRVAVLGAGGMVGLEVVRVLSERAFPLERLDLYGSDRRDRAPVELGGEELYIHPLRDDWWSEVDLAFFALPNEVSLREAPRAVAAGATVIDNSSAFRMNEDVPLVVPEVNSGDLLGHRGIIANPNCSAAQLVVALAPLERAFGLRRVHLSTYQSVSGAGWEAVDRLRQESGARLKGGTIADEGGPFPRPIGFNLFPQIGAFDENGWCSEETKIRDETRKILHHPDLPVTATVVRVPVERGHAEAVVIETIKRIDLQEARRVWDAAPGVELRGDRPGDYPTPMDVVGKDPVLIGRPRIDPDDPRRFHFWVVGDNLRKGAALNAVQLGEAVMALGAESPRPARGE